MSKLSSWLGWLQKDSLRGGNRRPFGTYVHHVKQSNMCLHNHWPAPINKTQWGNGKVRGKGDGVAFLHQRLEKECLWLDVDPSPCFLLPRWKPLFTFKALDSPPLSSMSWTLCGPRKVHGQKWSFIAICTVRCYRMMMLNSNFNFFKKMWHFLKTKIHVGKRQRDIGEEIKCKLGNPSIPTAVE